MTVEELINSKANHCYHCHTYNSWLSQYYYRRGEYLIGIMFHNMQDFYWRLAQ